MCTWMKELAVEISIPYKKEKGYVKGVNVKSLPIHGISWGTDIQVGPWKGKVDITITSLDDQKFYMGMNFLDKAKVVIVAHASTLFITENGQAHEIPLRRETQKEKVLPALRLMESREVGYLATSRWMRDPWVSYPQHRLGSWHKEGNRPERGWDTNAQRINVSSW